jgi:hypothetical protein
MAADPLLRDAAPVPILEVEAVVEHDPIELLLSIRGKVAEPVRMGHLLQAA